MSPKISPTGGNVSLSEIPGVFDGSVITICICDVMDLEETQRKFEK